MKNGVPRLNFTDPVAIRGDLPAPFSSRAGTASRPMTQRAPRALAIAAP